MIKLFSERQGIIKPVNLNPNEMPDGLRNRFWNAIKNYIDSSFENSVRIEVIKYLWDGFFKKDIDVLKSYHGYFYLDQIKAELYKLEWNKVYDFLEFLLDINTPRKSLFIKDVNQIFIDEKISYKIIDGLVISLISNEEVEEIEDAINNKYSETSKHIKKGLGLYCKRPIADYENSIKESISAIEALARIVLNKPSTTLGELADQLNIHPAFKGAIKKLYGWISDQGGIRHSEDGRKLKAGEEEARYMLVQCSALVNYIIAKNGK